MGRTFAIDGWYKPRLKHGIIGPSKWKIVRIGDAGRAGWLQTSSACSESATRYKEQRFRRSAAWLFSQNRPVTSGRS